MRVEEVSIGDYVLAGGEAAALVMVEAVARLLPGFMGNAESPIDDSFRRRDAGLEAPRTPGRRLARPRVPRSCSPATTRRSPAGATSSRRGAPRSGARTCLSARLITARRARLWHSGGTA